MSRALAATTAASLFFAAVAAPTPAKAADPWWFIAGVVVGAVVAPAYGYPYGYRSGYAPVRAQAPWADQPVMVEAPSPQCHWAKVQHNGAWRHARICYDGAAVQGPGPGAQFSDTIISK
jgi:hypothetical protein